MLRQILCSLILCSLTSFAFAEKRLAVFLPLSVSPRELEKTLKSDPILNGIDPTVFVKFDDFLESTQQKPFDFAVLPSFYSKYYTDYKPAFRFKRGGAESFRYLILSLEKQWTLEKINEGTVGIVDEFGRENMKKYISTIIKNREIKKLKRVTKYDDIFPLLAMGNADYTMIPQGMMDHLKEKYKSNPIEVARSEEVNNPEIYVKSSLAADAAPDFTKLSSATLKAFGFDSLISLR
jgi:hypothetical protein